MALDLQLSCIQCPYLLFNDVIGFFCYFKHILLINNSNTYGQFHVINPPIRLKVTSLSLLLYPIESSIDSNI